MQVTHNNGLEMESKETSISQLWSRYASYWPWFVFLLLLAVGVAAMRKMFGSNCITAI